MSCLSFTANADQTFENIPVWLNTLFCIRNDISVTIWLKEKMRQYLVCGFCFNDIALVLHELNLMIMFSRII